MLRVAKEVRVFPLMTLEGKRSPYINAILQILKNKGYLVKIIKVKYTFQKGAYEMLKITKREKDGKKF